MRLNILLTVIILLGFTTIISAQEKKDSLYYKIEEFSDQKKYTKFLHRLLFRREADSLSVTTHLEQQAPDNVVGKIIRTITIETTDPFGYKKSDRTKDRKWYDRLADRVHIDSKQSTIKNYLLFKEGEVYNAQKLYESERVLRDMQFVNRVNISVLENEIDSESVDVLVQVLDSWSLKPRFRLSGSKVGVGLTEENLLGLGHEASLFYADNFKDKNNELFGSYTAYNLWGSFINAGISGEKDFADNERITLEAKREFFSPLTRWGGGFTFEYFMRKVLMPMDNTEDFPEVQIKVYQQDLWGGYQFPVFRSNKQEISRNIAVLGRFQNYQYKDNPPSDKTGFFSTHTGLLASATFIERKFAVQKNIFQYNLPEDIPYGKSLGVTAGLLNRSEESIPYAGLSASLGSFTNFGYFTVKAEYGKFFNKEESNSNSYRVDGTYFTPLQNWKFAKVRHFFSPTYAIGNDLYNSSYKNRINLSPREEFPAYSTDFIGTKKLILRYQMQMYIDKTWKNFHFSPYTIFAMGWLSDKKEKIFDAKSNMKIGVGLLIDNPYLVFNRIQLSFMYYPNIPLDHKSAFEFNDYRNNMLPLHHFTTDKPHFVNFAD